jgi:flagellar biosynthesis/type III secretory pathway ATPase
LDAAIRARPQILEFLQQAPGVESSRTETLGRLAQIAAALG